jgi:hypothetical protein
MLHYNRARQDNSVRQYAQRFVSDDTDGGHNGLYWKGALDEFDSKLDPLIAAAGTEASESANSRSSVPFYGYNFRIMTSQGKNAHGGSKTYVVDGKMTSGFAFVAYPTKYGSSGVMTFIVGQDGIIYQKDLGPDAAEAATALTQYDPDSTWKPAKKD